MKSLIIIILLFSLINIGSAAEYHNVSGGMSIQTAINNAGPGDVIYVHNGTYNENIMINRSIALVGKNATIHGISLEDNVIDVVVDGVYVVGFNINSVPNGAYSGIYLHGSDHSCVIDNTVSIGYNNYEGIIVDSSYNVSIINNTLYDNTWGIRLEDSDGSTISGNDITDNMYRGIRVNNHSSDNIISNNYISGHDNYGISVYEYSDNNTIIGNIISHNGGTMGAGIWVSWWCDDTNIIDNTIQYNSDKAIYIRDGSTNTIIIGNDMSHNDGNGIGESCVIRVAEGAPCDRVIIKDNIICDNLDIYSGIIYIWECNNNQIINNTVTGNDGQRGVVYLTVSNDNIISDNNLSFNTGMAYGGVTMYSCINTTITRNVIVNNTNYNIYILWNGNNTIYDNYIGGDVAISIYSASTVNLWNVTRRPGPNIMGGPEIGGNYYTDYNGTDLDGDGFGNSSYLIQNVDADLDNYDYLPLMIPGDDPVSCGDATGDGNTNIIDVIEVYRHVCNPSHALVCVEAADVNCDSKVNIIDVIEIYRHVCNPSHILNCC